MSESLANLNMLERSGWQAAPTNSESQLCRRQVEVAINDVQRLQMLLLKHLPHLNHSWLIAKLSLMRTIMHSPTGGANQYPGFSLFWHTTDSGLHCEQEIQIMSLPQHNERLFELLRAST